MVELGLLLAAGAAGYLSIRYPWWRRAVPYERPRILMYHMVDDRPSDAPVPHLAVSPRQFAKQVRWLKRNGWHFATMGELTEPLPAKTVVLTFDDGYADNLSHAAPILQANGAKATIYLIADRSQPLAAGGDEHGNPLSPLLTDDQVVELLNTGVVELGAHTLNHTDLTKLPPAAQREQISASKAQLEQAFGCCVSSFAYPFGRYDERAMALVAEAGYASAVTTDSGMPHDLQAQCHQLPRVRISGADNFWNFRMRLRIGRKR